MNSDDVVNEFIRNKPYFTVLLYCLIFHYWLDYAALRICLPNVNASLMRSLRSSLHLACSLTLCHQALFHGRQFFHGLGLGVGWFWLTPVTHLLLCGLVPTRKGTGTIPWLRDWEPLLQKVTQGLQVTSPTLLGHTVSRLGF